MDLYAIADQIEASPYSEFLRSEFWFVPTLQSLHILGVCFVFTGLIFMFAKSFGLAKQVTTNPQLSEKLSPFLYYGYIALFATGILQVLAEPAREIPNPLFQIKLLLVLISIPMSLQIVKMFRQDRNVKLLSLISALNITAIIFAGRWIAYI